MQVIQPGEQFFINDYVAIFQGLERIDKVNFVTLDPDDAAVKANILVYGDDGDTLKMEPKFIIKDNNVAKPPELNQEIASRITLEEINPEDGSIGLGIETTQKDWIVLQAIENHTSMCYGLALW